MKSQIVAMQLISLRLVFDVKLSYNKTLSMKTQNITFLFTLLFSLMTKGLMAQSTMSQTFKDVDKLEMAVASGDVIFQKGPDSELSFDMEHTFGENYKPIINQRGSTLIIKEESRQGSYSGRATWSFKVPENIEISFNTGSGDVELEGLTVEVSMNSGSGDYKFRNASGEFKINTGSGDVEAEELEGELVINTGSGNVQLEKLNARIKANTGSGSIDVSELALTGPSRFNTGSGDSEVSLTGSPSFDIAVNSGSGDAVLDFSGNAMVGTLVMEANKRNGDIRASFDFDSSEEIDEGYNTKIRKTKKFSDADVKIRISSGSGTARAVK